MMVQEDCRTLREFYPDATLRHKVLYAFAHQFLPQYVWQNPRALFWSLLSDGLPGGTIDPTRFIHSRWSAIFEQRWELEPPRRNDSEGGIVLRRVTDLTMSLEEISQQPAALIQMPIPERSPQAYFICAVLLAPASRVEFWPADVEARVFTLEAEVTDRPGAKTGIFCEWRKDGTHRNFGFAITADREVFLQAITAMLNSADGAASPGDIG